MAHADAAPPAAAERISVEVVYCPAPGRCDLVALQLSAGACVADALRASGILARHVLDEAALKVGIWFKVRELATVLREGDRVEVYRPLTVDPKEARRQRCRRDRSGRGRAAAGVGSKDPEGQSAD